MYVVINYVVTKFMYVLVFFSQTKILLQLLRLFTPQEMHEDVNITIEPAFTDTDDHKYVYD